MKWSVEENILYGGDYNPEQWLNRPDILRDDIKLMKKAHISVVSLGIFAWSILEPKEGVFNFAWMDKIIKDLHDADIKIFLATPSGARPGWLAQKYPEVLRVNEHGQRNLFGGRHNHCFSSPVYRKKVSVINTKLSERYADHPSVILWHISNEYSQGCHCDYCQENFRDWLKKRYGTLDGLNKAWWNVFWSHTISDWSHIHSPVPHGETKVHGLNIDWLRFVTDMTVDFLKHEIQSVRAVREDIPVTTNMMWSHDNPEKEPRLDYWKFKDELDIYSWDSYPAWHLPGFEILPDEFIDEPVDDFRRASEVSFQHDLFRSLGDKPFLLMESTPSAVNWRSISKAKKQGMNILSGIQAIAHGSNSVQYFQWRKSRGSFEKFHGAVVDHSGSSETRVFKEAAELGRILKKIQPLASAEYPAETAIIFNWESRWAFDESKGPINNSQKKNLATIKKHYYSLWNESIPMDIISGESDMTKYRMVIAPMLYMTKDNVIENLKGYVQSGGILVSTYQTCYVNESDLCFEDGILGPLKDVQGIRVEEIDTLHQFESIGLVGDENTVITDYYEHIHLESATELARFNGGIAHDKPAITKNNYGLGKAYHLAGRMDIESLSLFYKRLIEENNLLSNKRYLKSSKGKINIQKRSTAENDFLFIMNFDDKEATVETSSNYFNTIDDSPAKSQWHLPPYGMLILQKNGDV